MKSRNTVWFLVICGLIFVAACAVGFSYMMDRTSTSSYCMSCHDHEDADAAWRQSVHYNGSTGTVTECAACHLPPSGTFAHIARKMQFGAGHMWSHLTKDKEDFDWEGMKELEHARKTVFNASCEACHNNLYPQGVTDEGITAHLYYEDKKKSNSDLQCISCHLDAGHYMPGYQHGQVTGKMAVSSGVRYEKPAEVEAFADFTETIPGTGAAIDMVAIPGGTFAMGSPENEPCRREDEGPVHQVTLSPFFMGKDEVTWDQFWAFYNETMSEGRTPPAVIYANNSRPDIDAVSGPTPPFGYPDHGWGMGSRPAITMTHYCAETFCQWLSLKTGRKYRLPTEAEWEYAARAGTETPYFFEGNPAKLGGKGLFNRIFPASKDSLVRYAVSGASSGGRTQEPDAVQPNPFGLRNMLGNVMEYCSDRYSPDAYRGGSVTNPTGPAEGDEYVVRGGCFSDSPQELRCAARSHTRHDAWLLTDPQSPKSIWWYSDVVGIGFRVVCEVPENIKTE